nr:S-layer homology domain-containing protein [uncultured Dysosmobacter sp.]
MQDAGTTSLWEFMEGKNITTFAGSKVNLHVKFDENLNVAKGSFDNIKLTSDWFQLADGYQNGLTKDSNGYWTIPCVIKAEKGTNNSPIINLSGITLSLTDKAQGKLNSNTALDITSEGYIDGTIKISTKILNEIITYELSLIGKSASDTVKNTAKLNLQTYTVTYDANGGSGTMTDKKSPYAYGAAATVLTNGFTRSRYTFTGWNTKADGSGDSYAEGDPIEMLGNVVLYAQWTRNSSHDNDDDKYFFAIQKVDAQDGHALNDAKFELYQRDNRGNKLAAFRKTTSHWGPESGIALFSVSATKTNEGGDTWYYREITAPEGYVLDTKEYEISATDFYHDDQSKAVAKAKTVRNYRGTTPDLLNDSDHFAYVIGYMDGNVRPYGLISRAETTTIFFRLLKDSVRDGNLLTSNTYTDVADDYWANTAISTMTGLGIVQGRSTTTFDPKAPITRAQFAAICARFDTGKSSGEQTFSDIQGHWAEKYIQRAAELGWIKGFEDGTFRPDTYITRAQAMTMINRVLNRIPEDESDLLPGMNVWPDCNPGDWFYLAVQEATNSHDFEHKAGNYETWTKLMKNPDWTRYEN